MVFSGRSGEIPGEAGGVGREGGAEFAATGLVPLTAGGRGEGDVGEGGVMS